jgi:hypothetical protein
MMSFQYDGMYFESLFHGKHKVYTNIEEIKKLLVDTLSLQHVRIPTLAASVELIIADVKVGPDNAVFAVCAPGDCMVLEI